MQNLDNFTWPYSTKIVTIQSEPWALLSILPVISGLLSPGYYFLWNDREMDMDIYLH